jgi:hypothetical protein
VLPPNVPQFFMPLRAPRPAGTAIVYQPRLLGLAQVRYVAVKAKVDVSQDLVMLTEITDSAVPVDWATSEELELDVNQLEKEPTPGEFAPAAPAASQVKNYATWAKDFSAWIQANRRLTLFRSPTLEQTSRPGEDERDFRIRLQQSGRERRDAVVEKLRTKYAPKMAVLQERLRRAEAAKEREEGQARQAKLDTLVSFGSTLLGAFLGRKAVSSSTVGRAATTAKGVGRSIQQSADVTRAVGSVEALRQQLNDLDAQFRAEADAVAGADPTLETLEAVEVRPTKTNIQVRLVALVWLPFTRDSLGITNPAW